MGGEIRNCDGDELVRSVSTDTRKIESGALFFALRGDRFDGHKFVPGAVDGGAVCCVVNRGEDSFGGLPVIAVEDTHKALRDLAACYRMRFRIPVVGVVTAGVPILAVENIERYIPWEGPTGCFALRVRGDSMIGAGILSGDTVIIRPQETAENGQIVVALLDDSATVKRLRRDETGVWLLPENPAYAPIDGREAAILGVVVALQREY